MNSDRKIDAGSNSSQSEADRRVQHLIPRIRSFSKYMGFAVSLIGLLVLSGRLLGIEQLNNVNNVYAVSKPAGKKFSDGFLG